MMLAIGSCGRASALDTRLAGDQFPGMPRQADMQSRAEIANIYDVVERSMGWTLEAVHGGPEISEMDLREDELLPSLREKPRFEKAMNALRDACAHRVVRAEYGQRTAREQETTVWVDRAHDAARLLVDTVPASPKSFETVARRYRP
jgi:hypothetical protein